ncbi:hypothetical protein Tco_0096114 [Tanacetum coccineum]
MREDVYFDDTRSTSSGVLVYTTLLSMVCVTYSAYVRSVDSLHVFPNRYSPRPNVMKQYRSSSLLVWLASTSSSLLLIYYSTSTSSSIEATSQFQNLLKI